VSPDRASERLSVSPDCPANDSVIAKLGPGLITGAADDDPSGIAAYAQSGAQFGYSLLWTLFLTYPLMVGIQVVSARIGRVSGYGLAGNIRRHYPKAVLYILVSLAEDEADAATERPSVRAWRIVDKAIHEVEVSVTA